MARASLAVRARNGRAPTARPCRPLRRAPLRRALCGRGCSGDHPAAPCALRDSCGSQPPHRARSARPCAVGSPRESQPPHHATAFTPPQHHLRKIAAATSRAHHRALRNPRESQPPDDTLQQPRQSPRPALTSPGCRGASVQTALFAPFRPEPIPDPPRPQPRLSLTSVPLRQNSAQPVRPTGCGSPASPGRSEPHRAHPVAEQVATRPHPSERRPRHRPGPAQPWYPATIFVNAYFGCEIPLHSPPPEQSRLVAQKVNRPRWWLEA